MARVMFKQAKIGGVKMRRELFFSAISGVLCALFLVISFKFAYEFVDLFLAKTFNLIAIFTMIIYASISLYSFAMFAMTAVIAFFGDDQ
jgi:membrane-associated HD superfamily phosphohydrolase